MPTTQFHTRSDEIQEIIGQIPSWTIQWGMTAIALVIAIFIFCSCYINFPDTLLADAFVSAQEQPFKVSWYKDGPQEHLIIVKEGETVGVGDTLLVERNLLNGAITPLVSAIQGKIAFQKGTADNPLKSVIFVNPMIKDMITEIYFPPKSFGKVKIGQKVLIRLDAYPSQDFGMLEGEIVTLGNTPYNDKYQASVKLNNGLITSEGKEITQQYVLTGNAEIILQEKSLFDRIFGALL